ncbi:MAG: hypothetical protein PHZ23_16290, partial [Acidiphilium sp.]|nr:hypothetical protein [Acidiphilium sp.]
MTHHLRITAIRPAYPADSWYLDRPSPAAIGGSENAIYLDLAGWVLATPPDPVLAIAIYAPTLHRSPLLVATLHPRADVAEIMGIDPATPTGFQTALNIVGLHHIGEIELFVVTASQWHGFVADSAYHTTQLDLLATITFTFEFTTPPAPPETPTPLFVTSLGRSGSTALMAALATSPDIATPETYPYETKPLAYAIHMARLAISPSLPHLPAAAAQFLDVPFIGATNPNLSPKDYPKLFNHYRTNGLQILQTFVRPQFTPAPTAPHPRYIAEKSTPNTLTIATAETIFPTTT